MKSKSVYTEPVRLKLVQLAQVAREAVVAPSLEAVKARLDGALRNLVWWKVSLPMAGELEPDDL